MDTRRTRGERLNKLGIVVQTEYQDQGKLKIRRSDGSLNDDVISGVVLDKKYYLESSLKHQETEFNPGILYSFVFPVFDEGRVICPNCGGVGKTDGFTDGCPFCGSYYNLEYESKDLGSRSNADYVSHGKVRLLPMLLSIFGCAALATLFTLLTSRTLLPFDVLKGIIVGVFVGALIGLFWSYLKSKGEISDADRAKKNRQEMMLNTLKANLSSLGSSLSEYTNAIVSELERYYFNDSTPENADVIDFDVLDYIRHNVNESGSDELFAETELLLRVIRCQKGKIDSEEQKLLMKLRKNQLQRARLNPGVNFRSCPNCGASLDLSQPRCAYCGTPYAYEKPYMCEGIETI